MSLQKLSCFIMLAVIVAFAAAGNSDRQGKEPNVPKPTGVIESFGHMAPPMNEPESSYSFEEVRSGRERGGREVMPEVFRPVQTRNADALAAGKLLVASRVLGDPNFAETVILLAHYDAQGVVGLVLNRRSHVPVSRVLEDLKAAKERSDPVYLGGPVDTAAVFALFESAARIEGAEQIFSGIYLISAKTLFEQTISTRPDPGVFHVYLGYAGWNKNQLRKEVEMGMWFIFPAEVSTVFNSDPDSLWPQMIRKTELKLARSNPAEADPWPRLFDLLR